LLLRAEHVVNLIAQLEPVHHALGRRQVGPLNPFRESGKRAANRLTENRIHHKKSKF
jgi:hypothetical protein